MSQLADEVGRAAQDLEVLRRDTHSTAFAEALRHVEGRLITVEEKVSEGSNIFARVQYGAIKALCDVFEVEHVSHDHREKAACALEVLRLFWDMGDGKGPWLMTAEDLALVKDELGETE